jgi:hypothetical protein
VYKAWFPLTHRWPGFEQARVIIDPPMIGHTDGTFSARLLVTGPVLACSPPDRTTAAVASTRYRSGSMANLDAGSVSTRSRTARSTRGRCAAPSRSRSPNARTG